MKSVFNTLFSILAGACAALLVMKYVGPTDSPSEEPRTEMRSYAPPPTAGTTSAWPDFTATIERAMQLWAAESK